MKVKQWWLYPVSLKDFLPARFRRLREQADKPLCHTRHNVNCQHQFAGSAAQEDYLVGRSSTLSLPTLGNCHAVSGFSGLNRNTSWPSRPFTFQGEASDGDLGSGALARPPVSWRLVYGWGFGTIKSLTTCRHDCTKAGDFNLNLINERRTHQ